MDLNDNKITEKKKLLFVISSLVGGGSERVITTILNHLNKEKYEISLVLFIKGGHYLSQIPDDVKLYDLKKKSRFSFLRLIFCLNGLFRKIKPNTVISFMAYTNLVVLLAKFLSGCKFNLVISIRTNLGYANLFAKFKRIKYFLYKRTFNFADHIVVPSVGIKKDLEKTFGIDQKKINIINNPIDLEKIKELKEELVEDLEIEKCKPFLITVGSLTRPKGYHYLLRAFSIIKKEIDEKFLILGTGKDEAKLKSLVNELGIREEVFFLGFQKNPYKFMKTASIFIISSIWEGFPNVILEAMVCGVPVISTDCPFGPREIITNGKNGILVPPADEKALSEAILALLKDSALRRNFSEEGKKRAEDFRIEKIIPQYEELF